MKPFSRILVALDLTQMDFVLIRFICRFMAINPFIKKIYFIHVARDLEEMGKKDAKFREGGIPADELLKTRMKQEVDRYYSGDTGVELRYKIVEGDRIKQLHHWSKIKYIDLIVAGKKIKAHGSGLMMEKLARKTNSSILFVPENYPMRFRKILIPIDFSKDTDSVFEVAKMIGKYLPDTKFICQHVVDVPHGYTRIGKTYEEFASIMLSNTRIRWKECEKLHQIEPLRIEPVFSLNEDDCVAKTILDYARSERVDLILMGSKKQTDASVFLLGSVGEELITRDKNILLLLVKDTRKRYDFFKAMGKV